MTIYRHPVPAHPGLPPCLPCIDLADGRFVPGECKRLRDACESKTFNCPNLDGSKSRRDKCWKSAFLHPRGARSWGFHFHQGVDLAGGRHGATIVSVTNGVVRMAASTYEAGVGGYGRTVVIESDLVLEGETTTLWFLYAHCKEILVSKGQVVVEQQPIATVGISDTYKPEHGKAVIFDGTDPSKSHLHFEVSRTAYPKGRGVESQIDDLPTLEDKPREDPLAILEMLGPWGPKQLSFPDGEKVDAETLLALHAEVEGGAGGYFPLGSNNLWHGGVHLPMAEGSKVVAPFDGVIVAARLDPDPDSNEGAFGDTNFILLRHVISEAVFNRIQGKPEDPSPSGGKGSGKKKTESVGRKGTNPPDLVTKVEKRLSELVDEATGAPFFDPAAGDLVAAIEAYQRSIGFRNPDGNITVGQRTWNALFPAVEPDGPDAPGPTSPVSDAERERVIYCLLMHLQARPLDGDLVEDVPWLRDVKLSPEPGDPEPPEEDDPKTIAEDEAEASRGIKGPVGAPDASGTPVAGDSGDVAWVQKRLRRLSDWTGASDGKLFNEALQAAIAKFQREHVTWYRKHPKEKPPGYVLPGKDTERALATPRHELLGKKSTKPQLDPVLKHRLSQRNADGTARIVTNLGARVGAGDTLWWSGRAAGFDGDSGTKDSAQVHWEIFSEEPLVMGWSELEDDDEDLRVDLPLWIYGVVETHVMPAEFEQDKIFTPAEIANFYADDRSNFLRMTRCQFRSEWGVDIDKLVGDLTGREWNTTGRRAAPPVRLVGRGGGRGRRLSLVAARLALQSDRAHRLVPGAPRCAPAAQRRRSRSGPLRHAGGACVLRQPGPDGRRRRARHRGRCAAGLTAHRRDRDGGVSRAADRALRGVRNGLEAPDGSGAGAGTAGQRDRVRHRAPGPRTGEGAHPGGRSQAHQGGREGGQGGPFARRRHAGGERHHERQRPGRARRTGAAEVPARVWRRRPDAARDRQRPQQDEDRLFAAAARAARRLRAASGRRGRGRHRRCCEPRGRLSDRRPNRARWTPDPRAA